MPFLQTKCPTCNKTFESVREFVLSGVTAQVGKCGHILRTEQLAKRDATSIVSLDGKKLFPFQSDTVGWLETNNGRALVAHEMGLGKTVCALSFIALHRETLPAVYIVKKSLTSQWQHEIMRWIGEDEFAQIISSSKEKFIPGCKHYIISYDMVARIKDFKEQCEKRGIRTLILDECQQIKNPEAQRTVAIRDLARLRPNSNGNREEELTKLADKNYKGVEHIIALSGTPIKNNAQEYFPILNILHPEIFPRYAEFVRWWCDSYWDGRKYKTGGLARPELFKTKTESFITRYEYEQVKDQLPTSADPITRNFSFHELAEEVEAAYKDEMRKFMDEIGLPDSGSFEHQGNILAYLSKMRHLSGLSLIDPAIDHVMEFLGSNDRKLMIFTHHKDVADVLAARLASVMQELDLAAPIQFRAGDNGPEFVEKFRLGPRVAIISTLAGGEGMDGLQFFCHDMIMLERQWNPANEEQAEKRISQRIGQEHNVTATYFIAIGTVVEFFSEIVERKREIVIETLGGRAVNWDESSLMKELSEILVSKGAKRWGL